MDEEVSVTDLQNEIDELSLINNQLLMNLVNCVDIIKIYEKNEPLSEEEKVVLSKTRNIIIQAENAITLIKK